MKAQEKRQRYDETAKLFMEIVDAKANDITRENANMNADTPSGMMMKFASETTKNFALDYLIDEEIAQAHKEGSIHIHDLDYYVTKSLTCLQHPLDKILSEGFRAGHGSSRPAKSIRTASMLACISLETNQNEMHGGQAIPAFDFYMAPYVRMTFEKELLKAARLFDYEDFFNPSSVVIDSYDVKPTKGLRDVKKIIQHAINETVDQTHQAMEAFIHNMNTIHSRGGNQVVFSSINYGTDTSAEGRLVMRELLESTYKGVGNGETPIFPIQIFKIKDGVNFKEGDPNYDLYKLACKVTAKRLFPNFVNLDAPFNRHEGWRADDPLRYTKEVSTMGCRTRTFEDRFGEKTPIGRGNLSFTTVNLPRLAIEASQSGCTSPLTDFYGRLDDAMELAAKQLYKRYGFQATAKAKQFPLLMSALWKNGEKLGPNDSVKEVLKHGTLSIGYVGLAEALVMLIGKHHGESEEAQELGLHIVSYMNGRIKHFSDRYDLNFSLLATPAESLAGRAVKKDRAKFGIIPGVTDRDYYTNSNHVPVYYKCTAKKKLEIEAPYHALTLAGHISYVELDGDATHNVEAIDAIVKLAHKLNIGYLSINHNRTRCLDCGYEGADDGEAGCPRCYSDNLDILARITGYLVGGMNRWNGGKKAEWKDRVTHG